MNSISVVIPCYNASAFIFETIQSVLCQKYLPIEIICIDDHSSDNTKAIISSIETDKCKIVLVDNKGKGASTARNMGLNLAKGEFIQFLDADDILHEDKFLFQLKTFEFYDNIDVVISDYEIKNENFSLLLNTVTFKDKQTNWLETSILHVITTCNPLYRTKVIKEVRGYDNDLTSAQDWEFHLRLILLGYKLKYLPGVFFSIRKVEGSLSSNWISVSINQCFILDKYRINIIQSDGFNKELKHYILKIYFNTIVYTRSHETYLKLINMFNNWYDYDYKFLPMGKRIILKLFGLGLLIRIYRFYYLSVKRVN